MCAIKQCRKLFVKHSIYSHNKNKLSVYYNDDKQINANSKHLLFFLDYCIYQYVEMVSVSYNIICTPQHFVIVSIFFKHYRMQS